MGEKKSIKISDENSDIFNAHNKDSEGKISVNEDQKNIDKANEDVPSDSADHQEKGMMTEIGINTDALEQDTPQVREEGPCPLAELNNQIAKLKEENSALQDKFLRLQAEFDNFRKRQAKERQEHLKYKHEDFLRDFLPVLDQFKVAFKMQEEIQDESTLQYFDGFRMIYDLILQLLDRYEVRMMDVLGKVFDPKYHDAIAREENHDYPDNTIISEFSAGYLYKDKVIIHPKVKVAINRK